MPFCPNCGAQANGSYCPNCGTAIGGRAGTGAPPSFDVSGLSDNVASALCYIPFFIGLIVDVVFLLVAPYNRNRTVRFHAFQSLFLHLALFLLFIVVGILSAILSSLTHTYIGLNGLVWLASLVLFLFLMYQAYNRRPVKLPVVGDLAQKQV